MKHINVNIANRVAVRAGDFQSYVCDNTDFAITFSFDAEWQSVPTRIARFVYTKDGVEHYIDVAFEGNCVQIPPLRDIGDLYVGVYAGTPGTQPLMATTPLRLGCSRSILCHEGIYGDLGGSELPEPDDGMLYLTDANGIYLTDTNGNFYTMEVNE